MQNWIGKNTQYENPKFHHTISCAILWSRWKKHKILFKSDQAKQKKIYNSETNGGEQEVVDQKTFS